MTQVCVHRTGGHRGVRLLPLPARHDDPRVAQHQSEEEQSAHDDKSEAQVLHRKLSCYHVLYYTCDSFSYLCMTKTGPLLYPLPLFSLMIIP